MKILKNYIAHIGTDESGKGDFFGPLVIAGVLVDEEGNVNFIFYKYTLYKHCNISNIKCFVILFL